PAQEHPRDVRAARPTHHPQRVRRALDRGRPAPGRVTSSVRAVTPRRLEAFSDGVFAIAATLLILNVTVTGAKPLDRELSDIWRRYAAYAIAFLTIGVIWANHHTVIDQCRHVNRLFLMLNVIFLM